MAATLKIYIATGAGPTTADAEATGIKFNREDTATGSTSVPKPTANGTNYSWQKSLFLQVTAGGGATTISNRKIRFATAPNAGLTGFFKDGGSVYAQAASGNKPTDNATTNDAVPAGYTALTTTFQNWDTANAAATNGARNGNYVVLCGGLSNLFLGGAGVNTALPAIEMQYDEF